LASPFGLVVLTAYTMAPLLVTLGFVFFILTNYSLAFRAYSDRTSEAKVHLAIATVILITKGF
jgi:putative effector of murein hydrolase